MGDLLLTLLPVIIGVNMTPMAIVAVVVIMTNPRRPLTNAVFYLLGWVIGIAAVTVLAVWLLTLVHAQATGRPPLWVAIAHFLLAAMMLCGAAVVLLRGRRVDRRVKELSQATTPRDMAEATAQLPGKLHDVDRFLPRRSLTIGFEMFAFNPLTVSFAIAAALAIVLSDLGAPARGITVAVFVVLSSVTVALPIVVVRFTGATARRSLHKIRRWVSGHYGYVNALVFLVVALVQTIRGFQSL